MARLWSPRCHQILSQRHYRKPQTLSQIGTSMATQFPILNFDSGNRRQPSTGRPGFSPWVPVLLLLERWDLAPLSSTPGDLTQATQIGPVPPVGAVPVGANGSEAALGSRYNSTDYGQFLPPNSRGFLGLEFTVGANTFFGYIQVQVNRSPGAGQPGFQFISAAYENTPGMAITAGAVPEPGTLALLAFGAAGVVALQRRRKQPKAG